MPFPIGVAIISRVLYSGIRIAGVSTRFKIRGSTVFITGKTPRYAAGAAISPTRTLVGYGTRGQATIRYRSGAGLQGAGIAGRVRLLEQLIPDYQYRLLTSQHEQFIGIAMPPTRRERTRAARLIQRAIRTATPVRTGALRRSTIARDHGRGLRIQMLFYGRFQNEGTRFFKRNRGYIQRGMRRALRRMPPHLALYYVKYIQLLNRKRYRRFVNFRSRRAANRRRGRVINNRLV